MATVENFGQGPAGNELSVTISDTGVVQAASLRALLSAYRFHFKSLELRAAQINTALRAALLGAGMMWIKVFLPKRFDPSYARLVLGYRSTKKYDLWKFANEGKTVSFTRDYAGFTASRTVGGEVTVAAPQPTPFVLSGASRALAMATARPVATVTSNSARLVVKLQLGAINFRNHDIFTTVPALEYQRVVEEAERLLRLGGVSGRSPGVVTRNLLGNQRVPGVANAG